MDPLSIAAGSAGLAVTCIQIVNTLYTWIDETREVDTTVTGLCEEINALSRVLDAISKAWKQNPMITVAETGADGNLWLIVKASLADCTSTLDKLNELLGDVEKSSFFGRGFLRRPAKHIKLSLRIKDITLYKDRIKSYNGAMTSALQMINVCLLMHSNSSQESVYRVLSGLKMQLGRVESAINTRDEPQFLTTEVLEENERIFYNLQQFVHAAETFHSSASSIVSDRARSTVWGGSVLGDPLTEEQTSRIENWIPPPINEEDELAEGSAALIEFSAAANSSANRASSAHTSPTTAVQDNHDSDSEYDIEKDITRKLEEMALKSLDQRDYANAETCFRKVIDRNETNETVSSDITLIRLKLALACLYQEKWGEAETIIVPIAMDKKAADVLAFHSLHALALKHIINVEFEKAEIYCKRALWGKRKKLGKTHSSLWETLSVLVHICDSRKDQNEAEVYRSLLPRSYAKDPELDPLKYLERATADVSLPVPPAVIPPVDVAPLVDVTPPVEVSSFWKNSVVPLINNSQDVHSSLPPIDQRTFSQAPEVPPRSALTTLPVEMRPQRPLTPELIAYSRKEALVPPQNLRNEMPQSLDRQPVPLSLLAHTSATSSGQSLIGSRQKAQLIVAVDFGTKFSAAAWAFVSNVSTEVKEGMITKWPGSDVHTKWKIPTVLYYDQYQKVVGWGCDVADALALTGYPKPGVQKVELFKLQLMLSENTDIEPINLPPLPPGKSAIDVRADYLRKLRQVIRSTLQNTLGEIFYREERNIQYIFIIPAIFNDAGKAAFHSAIIQAGFLRDDQDNRFEFISEPEAIALFCCKSGLLSVKLHGPILIVNCGEGTVDLIALEVEEENPIAFIECTAGSDDSCSSTALYRNFSKILRIRLRKMHLPNGSRLAGKAYAKSILDFENRIKGDFRNNGQKWAIDLDIESEFPEAGIEEGHMIFTNDEIQSCFEPVVNRVLEMIKSQILAIQGQNKILHIICVMGVFGSNEYLFQQIKLHVPPQFQVVRPIDSELGVFKGAVTSGILERIGRITSIARRTYLIEVPILFQIGYHPEDCRISSLDGRDYCRYTAKAILSKGQRLTGPIKVTLEKFIAPGDSLSFRDEIYCARDKYPMFVTEPTCLRIGTLVTNLSNKNPESHFRKFRSPNGIYYLIEYNLWTSLVGGKLHIESEFRGEVTGVVEISLELSG